MVRNFWFGAALGAVLIPTLFSCGSDEDKGAGTITRPQNPPCQNELAGDCGGECEEDGDCGAGTYCANNACTADCTASGGQCNGTCSDRGKCDGTIKTVTEPAPVNPDQGIDIGGIGGSAGGTGGSSCATGSSEAKLANVNMFLMFDQSSSMNQNNRWDMATSALVQFLQDPQTSGLKIALRFFASDEPMAGCNIQECNVEACSQPLIELGLLTEAAGDAQEATLVNAIESRDPNPEGPGTPISAALQGAINWSIDFNETAPDTEAAVVVFVTDGEPSGCEQDTNAIASIAAQGEAAGVLTFAVGLEGSSEEIMNAIAREGGTGSAVFVGDGNAEEDLLQALNEIRGQAMKCDFDLPTAANVDPTKVNVTLSVDGGSEEQWNKVGNEGQCGDSKAWHYDDETNPTSVVLCPAACEAATSTPGARIDVVFGCETGKPITR